MQIRMRFRFDHEPGDSERMTAQLKQCHAMGIELGAMVTVWICEPCAVLEAEFEAPDR
jgi:hypothetical protein